MKCVDIKRKMTGYYIVSNLQMTAFPPEERFTMEEILALYRIQFLLGGETAVRNPVL